MKNSSISIVEVDCLRLCMAICFAFGDYTAFILRSAKLKMQSQCTDVSTFHEVNLKEAFKEK